MITELREGEAIIQESAANFQKNIETVGGRLFLTNRRLVFEAHSFNVQGGITELELSVINSLQPCWTKLFGLIPLFPNSLAVLTEQEKEFRFVLSNRQAWITAIESQLNG